jgi:hypothetical protein
LFSLLVRREDCLRHGRLVEGVASRTVSLLLLRFGGVWVDVKMYFLFGRVVGLPASWEARLGHRFSDSVFASMVWGCVCGC